MESQPQNPEFRINPENFHPCVVNECTLVTVMCDKPCQLEDVNGSW